MSTHCDLRQSRLKCGEAWKLNRQGLLIYWLTKPATVWTLVSIASIEAIRVTVLHVVVVRS